MTKNKKVGIIGILAVTLVALVGIMWVSFNKPAYSFKLDVNPSIEIISNRLDKVLDVKPQNDDAKEMLKDFKIKDNDLEDVIEDLADLMVLSGYITGGDDNVVMITVKDNSVKTELVDRLNKAIAAYLENKQIEATILNQTISDELYNENTGKELVAQKIHEVDDDLSYEELANIKIGELLEIAESKNIDPTLLFSKIVSSNKQTETNTEFIGIEKAREIALELVNGEIVELELDDANDKDPKYSIEIILDGYEYEIELDAYTGKILEFEKDKLDDDDMKKITNQETQATKPKTTQNITLDQAKKIALDMTGGGKIIKAKYDDGDYEFEIINGNYEYELEVRARDGKVIEFEKKKLDDDDMKKAQTIKQETTKNITLDQAKKIALDMTGGGKIIKAKYDDGEYEFEIINGNYEYEIEIRAIDGKVIEFEKDDRD